MQIVPVTAIASQSFSVQLNGQQCQINLYQKANYGLFIDLIVNGTHILSATLCLNGVGLVRYPYLGFVGQLAFVDTQGSTDPAYTGLGTRYILTYTP